MYKSCNDIPLGDDFLEVSSQADVQLLIDKRRVFDALVCDAVSHVAVVTANIKALTWQPRTNTSPKTSRIMQRDSNKYADDKWQATAEIEGSSGQVG